MLLFCLYLMAPNCVLMLNTYCVKHQHIGVSMSHGAENLGLLYDATAESNK